MGWSLVLPVLEAKYFWAKLEPNRIVRVIKLKRSCAKSVRGFSYAAGIRMFWTSSFSFLSTWSIWFSMCIYIYIITKWNLKIKATCLPFPQKFLGDLKSRRCSLPSKARATSSARPSQGKSMAYRKVMEGL